MSDQQIPPRTGERDQPKASGGALAAHPSTIALARRERRSGNLPEVLLWRALKPRPGGFKFRRQHPVDRYSLDFACLAVRLGIEVDGEVHNRGDRPARDATRDATVSSHGFQVLRIPAREVLADLDAVVTLIAETCRARTPLHQPAAGPPPRAGEVLRPHTSPVRGGGPPPQAVVEGPFPQAERP